MAVLPEEFLVAFLGASPGVQALIGAPPALRLYPDAAPQNESRLRATYQLVSEPQNYHLGGPSGQVMARIQVDCWSAWTIGTSAGQSYRDVRALAEAIRKANAGTLPAGRGLDGYAGTLFGLTVQRCSLEGQQSLPEAPQHADELPTRRLSQDWVITYVR